MWPSQVEYKPLHVDQPDTGIGVYLRLLRTKDNIMHENQGWKVIEKTKDIAKDQ